MNPMPRTLGILPAAITALFLVAYLGKEKPVLPSVPEPQAAPDSRTTVAAALAEGANSQACGGPSRRLKHSRLALHSQQPPPMGVLEAPPRHLRLPKRLTLLGSLKAE